ncbi:MAG: TonB-dependent siderophore receptor [Aquabacterium sp.]|uniref:TonB-dependent siderophore receptor n=1 Tax=Aquabacterium sp. TaxID=1872578 RepID=UPI002723A90A|nr:TonB-dependent siderophore receptor [Aquabacterium sp.]MDO9002584.1 TonB-dependent siderophore receptor [Aquabacterium sp.]
MTKSPIAWAALACFTLPVTAQEPPATEPEALPEVTVRATRRESPVGPVQGYVAKRSAAATKTDTPLTETPQAITVITSDAFEEQGALTAADIVRYTAGINSAYFDSRGDSFQSRGGNPTQYLDGLLRNSGSYNTTRPDPYTLERAEVLRGPSSVLYGQGGIGGVLNMVSKRPQKTAQRELQLQVGTNDRHQLATDLTGPLNDTGTLLYRLVAVGRESGTQVDYVPDDRLVIAPSLTWAPNSDTEINLQALYQEDKSGSLIGFFPWKGTLYPNPNGQIPFNTFSSEPGFDKYNTQQSAVAYQASHRINPTWTVRQNMRIADSKVDYYTMYTSFTAVPSASRPARPVFDTSNNRTVLRDVGIQLNSAKLSMLDTQGEARFSTGQVTHTLLLGLDTQHIKTEQRTGRGTTPAFDLYAPVYGSAFTVPAVTEQPPNTLRQTGVYVQDQLKFGQHWAATFGLRHDQAQNVTDALGNRAAAKIKSHANTKRAGLLYIADNGWTPYLSYSESFQPLTGTDIAGAPFKPQRGSQWEAGVKFQPLDSRMLYTLAVYDLYDENRKTAHPTDPTYSVQMGKVHVKGLELEARGPLNRQWDWIGSYAYTDAVVAESNTKIAIFDLNGTSIGSVAEKGTHLSGTPKHMASSWLTYGIPFGPGRFKVGAGARYIGTSTDGTDRNKVPAVTLIDAMVSYDTGDWRLALNVNNLADKLYLTTCLARGDCFLGQRRTAVATASYRF